MTRVGRWSLPPLIIVDDPPVAFQREVGAGEGDIEMDVCIPSVLGRVPNSGVQYGEVEFINHSIQLFASMVVLGSSPESVPRHSCRRI